MTVIRLVKIGVKFHHFDHIIFHPAQLAPITRGNPNSSGISRRKTVAARFPTILPFRQGFPSSFCRVADFTNAPSLPLPENRCFSTKTIPNPVGWIRRYAPHPTVIPRGGCATLIHPTRPREYAHFRKVPKGLGGGAKFNALRGVKQTIPAAG